MAFLPWALGLLASQRITVPVATGLVITSYLMAVSGWIHGLVALCIFAMCAFWNQRGNWSTGQVVAAATALLSGGLLAGPQLIATIEAVSYGTRGSGVSSSGMLTLDLQTLLAGTMIPPYLCRLNWGPPEAWLSGGALPSPPIAYCAWFLAPALALVIRRSALGPNAKWLLFGASVIGLLMLGPEQLGPMRWPLRFIPAFCLTSLGRII